MQLVRSFEIYALDINIVYHELVKTAILLNSFACQNSFWPAPGVLPLTHIFYKPMLLDSRVVLIYCIAARFEK
jgi:hypothetical protein